MCFLLFPRGRLLEGINAVKLQTNKVEFKEGSDKGKTETFFVGQTVFGKLPCKKHVGRQLRRVLQLSAPPFTCWFLQSKEYKGSPESRSGGAGRKSFTALAAWSSFSSPLMILWMDEIHFAPPKTPYDSIPLQNTNQQCFPWFQSGAGNRPSTVGTPCLHARVTF